MHPPRQGSKPQPPRLPTISTAVLPANATDTDTHSDSSRRRSNSRANPDFTRPGLESALHRRTNHPGAPARLNLASTHEPNSDGEPYPSIASVAFYSPSAPIPIPARPLPSSRPTTPLTGRAAKSAGFPFSHDDPSQKSPFGHSPSSGSSSKTISPARSQSPCMSPSVMSREQTPHRTQPSSPLSPAMPLSPLLPYTLDGRTSGRAGPRVQMPALPRLHPANFPSSHPPERGSSQRSHSRNPRHPLSHAQHKLYKYQRDLIANATRPSPPVALPTLPDLSPPRLHPLGSPGPVTPLTLEEKGDYLAAGAAGAAASPYQLGGRADGELVEKLIRQEHERTTRSAMRSDRHSPAISPAGGRG